MHHPRETPLDLQVTDAPAGDVRALPSTPIHAGIRESGFCVLLPGGHLERIQGCCIERKLFGGAGPGIDARPAPGMPGQ